MVGFPTETQEQYLDTEQMLQDIEVAFPHVFSYSERSGTPAARIPQGKQVPVVERKERNLRLRQSVEEMQHNLRHSKIGMSAWVLPEKTAKKHGFTVCRAEDYLAVLVPENMVQQGSWTQVCYESIQDGYLIAKNTV